jgi:hypothetical protein
MPGLIAFVVAGVIVIVLVLWTIGVYNRLVSLRNRLRNALAQIDVQLKGDTTSFRTSSRPRRPT